MILIGDSFIIFNALIKLLCSFYINKCFLKFIFILFLYDEKRIFLLCVYFPVGQFKTIALLLVLVLEKQGEDH